MTTEVKPTSGQEEKKSFQRRIVNEFESNRLLKESSKELMTREEFTFIVDMETHDFWSYIKQRTSTVFHGVSNYKRRSPRGIQILKPMPKYTQKPLNLVD